MTSVVNYEDGHLLVAAVRVLEHKHKRPPTVEEIAGLLGWSREWAGVAAAALEKAGVVTQLESAFVVRVEVKDHRRLEKLPRAAEESGIDEELREFTEKRRKDEAKLADLFGSGEAVRREQEKMEEMADRFQKFQPRPPRPSPLFPDEPADKDKDE